MTHELRARVSSLCASQVEVSYEVADTSVIEAYNKKYGTEYEMFDATAVDFGKCCCHCSFRRGVCRIGIGEIF